MPCVIYAEAGRTVIDDPEFRDVPSVRAGTQPFAPTQRHAQQPTQPMQPQTVTQAREPTKAPSLSMYSRPIALQWEGVADLIAGTATMAEQERKGKVTVQLPDKKGECQGTYQFADASTGTWSLACDNGEAASGTFRSAGSGAGSTGAGLDTKGRQVRFTLSART